jgi:hypothetical protein
MNGKRPACVALLIVLAVAACATKGTTAPRPLPILDGIYHFSERPVQLQDAIEGTLTVISDTVIVDAQPGPCRYDQQQSWGRDHPYVYLCAEITLRFDRYNPVQKASYHTMTTIYERRTVCVRYETNSSGQRVCVQQETQEVPRKISVSGSLHMTRVQNPD